MLFINGVSSSSKARQHSNLQTSLQMDNLERLNSSEYHTTDIAAGDCDRQFNTSEVQHKTYREKYIDPPSRLECGSVVSTFESLTNLTFKTKKVHL